MAFHIIKSVFRSGIAAQKTFQQFQKRITVSALLFFHLEFRNIFPKRNDQIFRLEVDQILILTVVVLLKSKFKNSARFVLRSFFVVM